MANPDRLLVVITDHDWQFHGSAWDLIQFETHILPIYPAKEAHTPLDRSSQKEELVQAALTEAKQFHPNKVVAFSTDPNFGRSLAQLFIREQSFPSASIVLVEAVIDDYRYRKIAREMGLVAVSYKNYLKLLAGAEFKTT